MLIPWHRGARRTVRVLLCVGLSMLAASCAAEAPAGLTSAEGIIRGRTGTIQGPLLMGEDFERELKGKLGEAAASSRKRVAVPPQLADLRPPAEEDWKVDSWTPPPDADVIAGNQVGSGACVSYSPPLSLGCRTTGQGTGLARAAVVKADRGRFDVLCVAEEGCFAYTVSSPCLKYRAPADGWVRIDFAVALIGRGRLEGVEADGAGLQIGLYAAHCWPKDQGKYWQEAALVLKPGSPDLELDGRVLTMTAYFPVAEDGQYSFGTGLTTLVWARPSSRAFLRLWGRELHATVRFLDELPAGVRPPYRR